MKPGATINPEPSMTVAASAPSRWPMAATRPPEMATSATTQGLPVPSTIRPERMTMSYRPPATAYAAASTVNAVSSDAIFLVMGSAPRAAGQLPIRVSSSRTLGAMVKPVAP